MTNNNNNNFSCSHSTSSITKAIYKEIMDIQSLRKQIEYQREIGCNKTADILAEDLEKKMQSLGLSKSSEEKGMKSKK